jgi:hypothetical protein
MEVSFHPVSQSNVHLLSLLCWIWKMSVHKEANIEAIMESSDVDFEGGRLFWARV